MSKGGSKTSKYTEKKMANDYFKRVQELTATRYWINNPTRAQTKKAIECGAAGCTLNPSYMSKVLEEPEEKESVLKKIKELVSTEKDNTAVAEKLQTFLVTAIAEMFLPVYEATGGNQGRVSIQGDPFNEKAAHIVEYGRHNAAQLPNITPKVPVVPEGLRAIGVLLKDGISINSTEIFTMQQFIDVAEVYREAAKSMKTPPTLFYSHIIGIFDEYLQNYVKDNNVDIVPDVLWQAGTAVAKKMEQLRIERGYKVRMISGGARGLQHFTEMVGAESCITINWTGASDLLLEQNPMVIQRFLQPTPYSVLDELAAKLPDFRKAYEAGAIQSGEYEDYGPVQLFFNSFRAGWKKVLAVIEQCRKDQ
jgi:transaldolase